MERARIGSESRACDLPHSATGAFGIFHRKRTPLGNPGASRFDSPVFVHNSCAYASVTPSVLHTSFRRGMRGILERVPMLGGLLQHFYWRLREARKPPTPFPGTAAYWEKRYSEGGNSGIGS